MLSNNMIEIWKPILNYSNYEVSSFGRIKSLNRNLIMKPINGHKKMGYLSVMLYSNGIGKKYFIHRLVGAAFLGESDLVINHKDSDPSNNKINNLEFVTQKENIAHSIEAGRTDHKTLWQKRSTTKVSKEQRKEMILMRHSGYSSKSLARIFKISQGRVNQLTKGYSK